MYKVGILTLSDKGAAGEREDLSGPKIPDDRKMIEEELKRLADEAGCDLILTTGGTGFSQRDVTPEATYAVMERNAPGIAEAMRAFSMTITKRAMLSREASVIRGKTLIVNLPGSPKAVAECLGFILDGLSHGLEMLQSGGSADCART